MQKLRSSELFLLPTVFRFFEDGELWFLCGGFCGACRLQKNAPRGLGQGIAPRQRAKHTIRLWLAPCLNGVSSA